MLMSTVEGSKENRNKNPTLVVSMVGFNCAIFGSCIERKRIKLK